MKVYTIYPCEGWVPRRCLVSAVQHCTVQSVQHSTVQCSAVLTVQTHGQLLRADVSPGAFSFGGYLANEALHLGYIAGESFERQWRGRRGGE
jgi:hypothetical protein